MPLNELPAFIERLQQRYCSFATVVEAIFKQRSSCSKDTTNHDWTWAVESQERKTVEVWSLFPQGLILIFRDYSSVRRQLHDEVNAAKDEALAFTKKNSLLSVENQELKMKLKGHNDKFETLRSELDRAALKRDILKK